MPRNDGGIVGTDPEAHERTDVTKQRIKDRRLDLTQILVGESEGETILAQLGDHVSQRAGGEGVELVDVQEEGSAFRLRDRVTAKGRVGEAGEDHASEYIGDVAAQLSLGEVDDQDLSFVHYLAEAKRFLRLGECPAHDWVRQECAELVGNWRNTVEGGLVVHRWKLLGPELPHLLISDTVDNFFSKRLVQEQPHDVSQIGPGLFEKRQQGVAQDVFHSRAPGIGPLLLQRVDQARDNQRSELVGRPGQRVIAIGGIRIRHVPDQRRLRARPRDLSCQIAMRIYQTEPVALPEILAHEVIEKRRLASAGLSEDVDVLHPIREPYAGGLIAITAVSRTDHRDAVGVPVHSNSLANKASPP